ncbi:Metallo-dependent phosphatase-like protein [Penicillium longicatenatum]|uniref:Metallo-dependent phosphatase-like protein n=1 Tax=Penicillium longicatenatum TaxID=1561947 RepID=UPI00254939B7|nr:Metallo-dependent phosphatase-like protein [Penicillium longicatenatum]KAJ5639550.1 Metallo-dependent phosphatase-like protein [Penicillium longicatenatum]
MDRFATLVSAALTAFALFSTSEAACSPRKNDTCPMQVRSAYAGPEGMVVSWNTYSRLSDPFVRYGKSPHHMDKVAVSEVSVTYPTSTTYNNHVSIKDLEPNTVYYYVPVDGKEQTPFKFKTSRSAGDKSPYSIAVVVDLGLIGPDGLTTHVGTGAANPLKPGDKNTIQSLEAQGAETEFLWHPGDIAYADYWLKEEIQGFLPNTTIEGGAKVYETLLNQFYDEMTAVTGVKPYMVGPGNHEANCDNGGTTDKAHGIKYNVSICLPGQTNFTGFINHFRMPSAQSGGLGNFWYSFDYGMVHYVQLDTETDLGHGFIAPDEPNGVEAEDAGPFSNLKNAQTKWLAKDLASVDRSKTPWIIVAGHRPWYASIGTDASDNCFDCKDVFEPLFLENNVDLVLSGHVHAYERTAPTANFTADPKELDNPSSPWYIMNGAAGHYDGLDTLIEPRNSYSRFSQDTAYGWSRLTFHNCTHLTHEFVASANGTVLDTATLFKGHKC